jgi:hypothetical protein
MWLNIVLVLSVSSLAILTLSVWIGKSIALAYRYECDEDDSTYRATLIPATEYGSLRSRPDSVRISRPYRHR